MYKLSKNGLFVDRLNTGQSLIYPVGSVSSIQCDPENTEYQVYLAWLAEGNTPLPAEENN
jgi:hypothetical protein